MEIFNQVSPNSIEKPFSFEKKMDEPGVVSYEFDNLVIRVDKLNIDYTKIPEMSFLVFDEDKQRHSLGKPKSKKHSVNMEYITSCVESVMRDSNVNEFWIYPYGLDTLGDMGIRQDARIKLFSRYFDIQKASDREGYVLKKKE